MDKEKLFTINKEDFEVKSIRCPGRGGQNVNKVNSGIFLRHLPSGAFVKSCSERSQSANKRNAIKRIVETPTFKSWLWGAVAEITTGKTIEERVEEEMDPKNIKVEVRDSNGKWVTEKIND